MGYSKKLYNVLGGGYAYYNIMSNSFCISQKITNFTKLPFCFCAFFPNAVCEYVQRAGPACPFLIKMQISLNYFSQQRHLYEQCLKFFSANLFFLKKQFRAFMQHAFILLDNVCRLFIAIVDNGFYLFINFTTDGLTMRFSMC